jgi:hypothetical protein
MWRDAITAGLVPGKVVAIQEQNAGTSVRGGDGRCGASWPCPSYRYVEHIMKPNVLLS